MIGHTSNWYRGGEGTYEVEDLPGKDESVNRFHDFLNAGREVLPVKILGIYLWGAATLEGDIEGELQAFVPVIDVEDFLGDGRVPPCGLP
jgi:hypothetical protein